MRNPCQASELAPDERIVLELVGVTTGRIIKPAPEGEAREEAWKRMLEGMREMQERVKDVPEEELYALIDEAIEYVRHNPERELRSMRRFSFESTPARPVSPSR